VTLPEISKVLAAYPGVRRAETAVVRHDGRDVTIAAAELSGYVSGPILRNHVRRELGEDSGLAGVLIVERMPMTDGAVDLRDCWKGESSSTRESSRGNPHHRERQSARRRSWRCASWRHRVPAW